MKRLLVAAATLALLLAMAPAAEAALTPRWRIDIGAAVNDVAVGPHGAIYVMGAGPPGTLSYEGGRATISRLSPTGAVKWTRTWKPHPERPRAFMAEATAVAVGSNGVVYVVGNVRRFNCEGGGWFVRSYSPRGKLLHTAGPESAWYCRAPGPQTVRDVAVRGDLVVVAAVRTGCCGTSALLDGYLRGYSTDLRTRWTSNFEPPAPTPAKWFDVADSVSIAGDGSVLAAGWSAIQRSNGEMEVPGSLTVAKFGHGGRPAWSKRPGVMMGYDGQVSMALGSSHMLIVADLRGGGIWSSALTMAAVPVWRRTWGSDATIRATLGGVATDSLGRLWLTGSRKDNSDSGRNVFVRRYGASGAVTGSLTIDSLPRWVDGNSITTLGPAAFVAGTASQPRHSVLLNGKVWRIGG